jgi:dTDP-4-dehydrorhamnose 3,5-epimerase
MRFTELILPGVWLIEPEPLADDRGFFARIWCERELRDHGLETRLAQCSVSFNRRRGTLRGIHYQKEPYNEAKLVRCTRGALFYVAVDLRRSSSAFGRHVGLELSADNRKMVYLPRGCANGIQTLEDETELVYQISEFYRPEYAVGVRWDDPELAIDWPVADPVISDRDRSLPLLEGALVCV